MPRFLFRIVKDNRDAETISVDLDGVDAARDEASRYLAEELRAHPHQLWDDTEWRVEVADERGLILFTVYSAVFNAASTGGP